MTRDEYIRWIDERIDAAEVRRLTATERGEQLINVGYRDAYIHARDLARRITSLATESELAYAHGDH